MKAIILAAGRGTRISRYLHGNPKCTVDIGGELLIEYTIKMLNSNGIKDIAICTGYEHKVIEDILSKYNINYFYNPFFDVTNSIASIWFAKDFITLNDDYLIMNGDVYMEESVLKQALECKKSPVLFSDEKRIKEADYRFKYKDCILEKYGKDLLDEETTGEYVGIGIIRKNFISIFKEKLLALINSQQHSVWWENILYSMVPTTDIFVENVGDKFWAEVDYIEDYERILENRKNNFLRID